MKRKDCLYVIVTMLLVMLILFCTTETVMSQSRTSRQRQYYSDMEKQYLSNIKNTLCEKGYPCSGITMRWMSDDGNVRNYTVMIHHRKINLLGNNEKEALLNELSVSEFNNESCTFSYEFITT